MTRSLPSWMRWLLLTGFAGALLVLIWSAVIEPRLISEECYVIDIPALPPEWEDERVALIADPHVGMWLSNVGTLRRIVARLLEIKPAAVLIAGDLIYEPLPDELPAVRESHEHRENAVADIDEVVQLLRPLKEAGIPTFAVLGNHDRETEPLKPRRAALLTDALERAGIRVLVDEAVRLPSPGRNRADADLWLVGLASHKARRDHSEAALAQLPEAAPRLVLMHNPDRFEHLPAGSAPLALAGHTHGGQIRFPFLLLRRLLGRVNKKRPQLSGWIDNYGQPGNRLYITRGIGFSRLPLRFNAPPEMTLFTLQRRICGGQLAA